MAAVVAVALYALAPRMAAQPGIGPALMRWHAQVDRLRDTLEAQSERLGANLRDAVRSTRPAAGD